MARNNYTPYQASEEFYNLFFDKGRRISLIDYLDNSFCDEMGEIDLRNDTFTIFYHVENKYANPVTGGSYRDFYNYIYNNVVHPEDREKYQRSAYATIALATEELTNSVVEFNNEGVIVEKQEIRREKEKEPEIEM